VSVEDEIKIKSEQIKKEVRWWSYAGWTLPFIVLAGLFFLEMFGWDSVYHQALTVGGTVLFTISVYWWWWAIHKIFNFADMMTATAARLKSIKEEFSKIKDNLK